MDLDLVHFYLNMCYIKVVANFLLALGAHLNILFITKANILVLIKRSHGFPPPICIDC